MLVHLAFIIMGGRDETREVNLTGSRNVFAAARQVKRLVYTSSVAAYGFHADNPQPLTEDVPPRGSEASTTRRRRPSSSQALEEEIDGRRRRGIRAAAVHRRRAGRAGAAEPAPAEPSSPGPILPLMPDPGVEFQLVHHDDVASALVAATLGQGPPGDLQPGRRGDDHARRPRPRARLVLRAGAAHRVRVASLARKLPLVPSQAEWLVAGRVPVVMDTDARAERTRLAAALQHARDAGRASRDVARRARPDCARRCRCRSTASTTAAITIMTVMSAAIPPPSMPAAKTVRLIGITAKRVLPQ